LFGLLPFALLLPPPIARNLLSAPQVRLLAKPIPQACAGCAALLGDLEAIRGALPALPVPPRRRDYRLTDEDAARLRAPPRARLPPDGTRERAGASLHA
jgi:hypothetical protein